MASTAKPLSACEEPELLVAVELIARHVLGLVLDARRIVIDVGLALDARLVVLAARALLVHLLVGGAGARRRHAGGVGHGGAIAVPHRIGNVLRTRGVAR